MSELQTKILIHLIKRYHEAIAHESCDEEAVEQLDSEERRILSQLLDELNDEEYGGPYAEFSMSSLCHLTLYWLGTEV